MFCETFLAPGQGTNNLHKVWSCTCSSEALFVLCAPALHYLGSSGEVPQQLNFANALLDKDEEGAPIRVGVHADEDKSPKGTRDRSQKVTRDKSQKVRKPDDTRDKSQQVMV